MKKNPNKFKNNFSIWIKYTTLGTEMFAAIFICTIIGYQIDKWLENNIKWATIIFLFIGLAAAFRIVYNQIK
ncbi:MAG TPA: AtpZ/AtpI family protein [Chitinophagales bacterium]|nr:AtpZ/AtpI family protein [Chitinophagales bacterium]